MNKPTLKEQAHGEIEKIFRILLPQNGLSVREEQITLCHAMLDTLLKNNIALCDAGVGIGKTYAYLTACILLKKFAPHGPAGSQPVVISTSSVALQDSIIEEYIPFLSRIFLENRVISKPIRAIVRKGKERFVCDYDEYEILACHQANKLIISNLARKIKFPLSKIPLSIVDYGNTGCASIPLAICEHYSNKNTSQDSGKILTCGFGIGLSLGIVGITVEPQNCFPVFRVKERYDDGLSFEDYK